MQLHKNSTHYPIKMGQYGISQPFLCTSGVLHLKSIDFTPPPSTISWRLRSKAPEHPESELSSRRTPWKRQGLAMLDDECVLTHDLALIGTLSSRGHGCTRLWYRGAFSAWITRLKCAIGQGFRSPKFPSRRRLDPESALSDCRTVREKTRIKLSPLIVFYNKKLMLLSI